jgi:hypothetical protein
MTKIERKELMHDVFEKGWAQSKKFIAFALTEVLMAIMAIVALKHQASIGWTLSAFMTGIVFVMGFVATVFLGKQADLDKFVRMAALNYKNPNPNQLSENGTAARFPSEK